ncbi:MAG: hypothetical protein M1832_000142 [Thelocarpon impressellum]|nr:MAG: hypothetical protein M1832_000142 [Thelocarpon impressellum]
MSARGADVETQAPVVLAVTTAVVVASSLFVLLRFISRVAIVRRVSWDDYFMALAWVIAFGLSFSICYGTSRGLGRHDVDIPPEWQYSLTRAQYAFSVLYNPALMATKTSILVFYLNLSRTEPIFRWASMATLIVVNTAGLALTFLNIFQCRPVQDVFLDPLPASAQCIDIVTLYLSSAPVNIITDLAILFLPMPVLTAMRLPRKQKRILVFTFALGGFVTIVDVVRIASLQKASLSRLQDNGRASSRLAGRDDFAWYASLSYMWTAVEVNVGIICACIPTLKPLLVRVLPGMVHDAESISVKSPGAEEGAQGEQLDAATAIRLPSQAEATRTGPSAPGADMGMMDFLTTPDMNDFVGQPKPAAGRAPAQGSNVFYDFVNAPRAKSMVNMNGRDSYLPLAMVTILFFLWGFAYGLLDTLNSQFQLVVHMSAGQDTALHSAYWAGYFVGPLTVGRVVLKKWGFKATFITGLCIYACGSLIFWPSAVLASFPAFLISNFVVGLGLATLEVAANPFIILCGPMKYAETRLNVAQGVQAIGSVVSPILATRVLFSRVRDAPSLIDAQWTYLSIALFDIALAVVFYYIPLPEAADDDLEDIADNRSGLGSRRVCGFPVVYVTLGLGVFSQFCYVGGQESVSTTFQQLIEAVRPGWVHGPRLQRLRTGRLTVFRSDTLSPFNYQAIAHTCFAVGRFLAAFMGAFMKPRRILGLFYIGAIVSSALAMSLSGTSGISMIILVVFFESAIWPMIFAISLRSLGRHTKTGSALLTAAASGGAIFPVVMNAVANGRGLRYSLCVVLVLFSFGTIFPCYLNTFSAAKMQVDPVRESLGATSIGRRTSHSLQGLRLRAKKDDEGPTIEHIEDKC